MAQLNPGPGTGLKVVSVARFDKLAPLAPSVITGKLGTAPAGWLVAQRSPFFGEFGFGQP